MKANKISTLTIALTGVFTALVFVVTFYIRVPMLGTNGYVNIGDSIIFICAAILGPIPTMIAGGLGSAFADLFGYPTWAPFTLVIKGLEGFICAILIRTMSKEKNSRLTNACFGFVAMLVSAMFMVTMYFFAGWILSGFGGAVGSIVGNIIQGAVSLAIAMVAVYTFNLPKLANRILNKNKQQYSDSPQNDNAVVTDEDSSMSNSSDFTTSADCDKTIADKDDEPLQKN